MRATAIVPVKRFGAAKQRLGLGIEEERRRELVAAMLRDVLTAIAAARMIERTIVVTGESLAEEIAAAAGAEVLSDREDAGHSEAASLGVEAAVAAGAACAALLPGDCPLLEPRELDRALTGIPSRYVAVVPDRHGTGTNALILSPPDAIRPAFGEGSCERHVAAARAAGVPHAVERLESLALDLDTPADLVALTRVIERGEGRARNTARALGL
jgi:2-phospho-L-lactate/phosphoenolpyruvate guanylyltransferase